MQRYQTIKQCIVSGQFWLKGLLGSLGASLFLLVSIAMADALPAQLQTPIEPPVSHHGMRTSIKDATSGAQRHIHIHERDGIQALRYKCDQPVTNFSRAYSSDSYKIAYWGAGRV